jgi:hypothetical protein
VNIARTYFNEGRTQKALEISLALRHNPTEFYRLPDECNRLQKDLAAALQKEQLEFIMKQLNSKISAGQTSAAALAYALECIIE